MFLATERSHRWILLACCVILTVLWLPGLRYPVTADTAVYADLGENLWLHGRYTAAGVSSPKYLPLHALASYPFVFIAGTHVGMKLATLLAGFAVLLVTYLLLRRHLGSSVAIATVFLLTFHHAFVLMTMLGSADLLFAALFLGALAAYSRAADDRRYYILAGILMGLSCVTRFNGIPLIPFFLLYTVLRRRRDLLHPMFLTAVACSIVPLGLWLLRNGNPFHNEYVSELSSNSQGFIAQLISNIFFYSNPLHNILPILAFSALYGIVRNARRQEFLLLGMLSAWIFTAIWWVQAMRFAFPGYPILLGFGVLGLTDVWKIFLQGSRHSCLRIPVIGVSIFLIILTHVPFLCVYAYGACNALVDRHISWIPKNLGLSSEGFYTWDQVRRYFNDTVPEGSSLVVDSAINEHAWRKGVFRHDIHVIAEAKPGICPVFHISQHPREDETVLFQTTDAPVTALTTLPCM